MAGLTPSSASGRILTINAGSSSLKLAVIEIAGGEARTLVEAAIEGPASDRRFWLLEEGERHEEAMASDGGSSDFALAIPRLLSVAGGPLTGIGHRVVHGGSEHVLPERVTPALVTSLRELVPLAPLHLPASLDGIEAASGLLPGVEQVACFDTAFHADLPAVARCLPLPARAPHLHRAGFHGLSYEYVMSVLGERAPRRIVIAHLGHGASLAAVRDGKSVDTTMGLTPTGGIPMGTRSGDVDPGALFYIARSEELSLAQLEHMVNHQSGLLAVGGFADTKTLLERRSTDPRARLAIEMFVYAIRKAIGGFGVVLGGIDLLIFTGGIGEHATELRAEICAGLAPFDMEVRVIPAREDLVIARSVARLLSLPTPVPAGSSSQPA